MIVNFISPSSSYSDGALVIVKHVNEEIKDFVNDADEKYDGVIKKLIDCSKKDVKNNFFISQLVGKDIDCIIFVERKEDDANDLAFGGRLFSFIEANCKYLDKVYVFCSAQENMKLINDVAFGFLLKSYKFNNYKQRDKQDIQNNQTYSFFSPDYKRLEESSDEMFKVASSVFFARDLVTEPPNILYPESYAQRIKDRLSPVGVDVSVLEKRELEELNMNALLGVGQGSAKESRLVVMEWRGAGSENPVKLGLVGKGVTFDTGGISLKPSNGMELMKYDMAGSAAVVGSIYALALRKAKINAVGVVGLVENMPDGFAQRPSDVVISMSGKSIEVLNTDAEGRLVLADALWYTQDKFFPDFMIDFATLTGAVISALGTEYAAVFANNTELSDRLLKAGEDSGEKLWPLPFTKEYDSYMDSKIADVQNISSVKGGGAGTITAAKFLEHFIGGNKAWAHLDIAGTAWVQKSKGHVPEGATGFGVMLINKFVDDLLSL